MIHLLQFLLLQFSLILLLHKQYDSRLLTKKSQGNEGYSSMAMCYTHMKEDSFEGTRN